MYKTCISRLRLFNQNQCRLLSYTRVRASDVGKPQPYQTQKTTSSNKYGLPYKLKPGAKYTYIPYKWIWLGLFTLLGSEYVLWLYLEAQRRKDQGLNQQIFIPFKLIEKEHISSTCSIFTLRPLSKPKNTDIYAQAWKKGIWSVELKQPQLQISRFYTPLPSITAENEETADLRFFVRREAGGEVSNYLHNLENGSLVELRGPKVEYEIPEDINTILFIAGGTGIAPALQAAYHLSKKKTETSDISVKILWANRRAEDLELLGKDPFAKTYLNLHCLNPEEDSKATRKPKIYNGTEKVEGTEEQQSTEVQCYVDEEYTWIKEKVIGSQFSDLTKSIDLEKILVMVSGPDGLVGYLAGPKPWARGVQQQGELGGLLKKTIPESCKVWKL